MAESKKCDHEMCNCVIDGDTDYCTKHCEDAADQDLTEIKCDCGHSAC